MVIPTEAAVMILPEVTLFPQALLPLYIFEPRYRRMLADSLGGPRLFIVAMQKPDCAREVPSSVAGLGLIRVCVQNPDGTSHLILQGLQRVELAGAVRYKPYRVHRVRLLEPIPNDRANVDALLARVRDLVSKRIALGTPEQFLKDKKNTFAPGPSIKEIVGYLKQIQNPEEVADLVSCALLPGGAQRQTILETVDLESRLRYLIHFLMAEIHGHRGKRDGK
jgi:ATP-dependent Lon protease